MPLLLLVETQMFNPSCEGEFPTHLSIHLEEAMTRMQGPAAVDFYRALAQQIPKGKPM